jgi:hypothetical protein
MCCAPTPPPGRAHPRQRADQDPAGAVAHPQGPSRGQSRAGQPAHQPAGRLLSRRHRAVPRAALANRRRVPAPLSHRPRRRRPHPGQPRCPPAPPARQRPHVRRRTAPPPADRPSSRDQPGRGGRTGGLRAGPAGRHPGHQPPGTRAGSRDHRTPGGHADQHIVTSLPRAGHGSGRRRCSTSPMTPATPPPGRPRSTPRRSSAPATTPTPCASWPAPGSGSAGASGKTASPTTDQAPRGGEALGSLRFTQGTS